MVLTINNYVGMETGGADEASDVGGSPDFTEATIVRTGARSLRLPPITNATFDIDVGVASAGNDHILGFGIYFTDLSIAALRDFMVIRPNSTLRIALDTNGDIILRSGVTTVLTIGSNPLIVDTWNYIEVYFQNLDSGNAELFINDSSVGSVSAKDFLGTGAVTGYRFVGPNTGEGTIYIDDVYMMTGVTSAADRLGPAEVFMRQNVKGATSTPDAGGLGNAGFAPEVGTWDDVAETPLNTANEIEYQTTNEGGSVDSAQLNSDFDGDSNIKAIKGIWHLDRDGGGGSTHSVLLGDDSDGNSPAAATVALTTTPTTYVTIRETDLPQVSVPDKIRQGIWTAGGSQDHHLFEMWAMILHVPSAGGVETDVDLDLGTYAVVGNPIDILVDKEVDLDLGTYVVTGLSIDITFAMNVDLDLGSYVVTGPDIDILIDRVFDIVTGVYVLTGPDIDILVNLIVDLDTGVYAVIGFSIDFEVIVPVNLDTGTYAVASDGITFLIDRVVELDTGNYTVVGFDITFAIGENVNLDLGTYVVAGDDITILLGRVFDVETGLYTEAGLDIDMVIDQVIELDLGTYNVVGNVLDIIINELVTLTTGNYAVTGFDIDIVVNKVVDLDAGNYAVVGNDIQIVRTIPVNLDTGTLVLAGDDIDILIDRVFDVDTGNYSVVGNDITFLLDREVDLDLGSYALVGHILSIDLPTVTNVDFDLGSYVVTGPDIDIVLPTVDGLPPSVYRPGWINKHLKT